MPIPEKTILFDPILVSEFKNKVHGHSAIAKLAQAEPLSFAGNTEFVFSMDSEIDVVAENGPKSHGGVTVTPIKVLPIKFEYGARFPDEFIYASEEARMDYLKQFAEGFAKKFAKGFDMAVADGVNPRTGSPSSVIGVNCFKLGAGNQGSYDAAAVYEDIEAIIGNLADHEITGLAGSPKLRSDLAREKKENGEPYFPELGWGGKPETLNGIPCDFSTGLGTYSASGATLEGIVGDFANMFRWGIAKEIGVEVIEYGDPDNSGVDLKGHNQVYLRSEIYAGWAILDPSAFATINRI